MLVLINIAPTKSRYKRVHYATVESPECLETSVPFNDSVTSLVNFSADFTSFSMPLKVPSSSEELTKKNIHTQIKSEKYKNHQKVAKFIGCWPLTWPS